MKNFLDLEQKEKLFHFQKLCVLWYKEHNGIGLNGDDMGLGKSCESLSYLKIEKELRPALIICPAHLKLNWQAEINLWVKENSYIIYGKKSFTLPEFPFYIINYEILAEELKIKTGRYNNKGKEIIQKVLKDTSWIYKLASMNIKSIIIDECQALANDTSIRTKAINTLKSYYKKISFLPLSGTPINKKPSQFYNILHLISPSLFPNKYKFLYRYCNPKFNGFGWQFDGATNIEELNEKISKIMIRRTKDEVLTDLPLKRRMIVPMETSKVETEYFWKASLEFKAWAKDHINAGLEKQQNIDRLKQLSYLARRNSVMKWIEAYIEDDKKLVIGTYHKKVIADILNYFPSISLQIDGDISSTLKNENVKLFQNDKKYKLIVCQKNSVTGLTLTAANATVSVELAWNSSIEEQFEDRVRRISQKADSVFAYYLLSPLDRHCMDLIQDGNKVVKAIIDNEKNSEFFSKEELKKIEMIL